MSRYIDAQEAFNLLADAPQAIVPKAIWKVGIRSILDQCNAIDIVRCKECKHRPVKEDADGENYGFNLIEPTNGDERCPCLVEDGWYSWMPKDNFYCGYGERKE